MNKSYLFKLMNHIYYSGNGYSQAEAYRKAKQVMSFVRAYQDGCLLFISYRKAGDYSTTNRVAFRNKNYKRKTKGGDFSGMIRYYDLGRRGFRSFDASRFIEFGIVTPTDKLKKEIEETIKAEHYYVLGSYLHSSSDWDGFQVETLQFTDCLL